jgi:two-component system, NarL family, nitrate/nitrite response regulator NarL
MDHDIACTEQPLPRARVPFNPVTTYLVCRNALLRIGIGHVLSGSRFALAGASLNDLSDLPAVAGPEPALVLLCESLDPDTCVASLETLANACPSLRTVIMADNLTVHDVGRLCQAGLGGICPTAMSQSAFLKALEFVMLGETFLPACLSFELLEQRAGQHPWAGVPAQAGAAAMGTGTLSPRETQILRCLTQGASNKLIARELGVSEATVKVHLKAILRKVKADNRTQAALWALEHMAFAVSADAAFA